MNIYILFKDPSIHYENHLYTKLAVYKLSFHEKYVWQLWDTLYSGKEKWFAAVTLNQFRHGHKIKNHKKGFHYLEFYGLKPKKSTKRREHYVQANRTPQQNVSN